MFVFWVAQQHTSYYVMLFHNSPYKVEEWSSAINRNRSPADKLLSELACQGITVKELAEFLDQLSIETFQLGLREYGKFTA